MHVQSLTLQGANELRCFVSRNAAGDPYRDFHAYILRWQVEAAATNFLRKTALPRWISLHDSDNRVFVRRQSC
jgi:hypothetical protein